jgi:hypothetical protein
MPAIGHDHFDLASKLLVACHAGTFRLNDAEPDKPPAVLAGVIRSHGVDRTTFLVLQFDASIPKARNDPSREEE